MLFSTGMSVAFTSLTSSRIYLHRGWGGTYRPQQENSTAAGNVQCSVQHQTSDAQAGSAVEAEDGLARPATPQQLLQELVRAGTGALSPMCDQGSDSSHADLCLQLDQWAILPEAVFADVINRLAPKDLG